MDINAAFPSKYLKAADLNGRAVQVRISHVSFEDVGGDTLPIVYFQGAAKGVVLNKTNSNSISSAYGTETDNWGGASMEVFPSTTDFQGKIVDCIRMRPFFEGTTPSIDQPPATNGAQNTPTSAVEQPAPPLPAAAPTGGASGLDDDIPFAPDK